MSPDSEITLPAKEKKLAVGGSQRGELLPGEPPTRHTPRIGLEPPEQGQGLEGREEQVPQRNDQLLRPGPGDLVRPDRKEIRTRRGGMAQRRVD